MGFDGDSEKIWFVRLDPIQAVENKKRGSKQREEGEKAETENEQNGLSVMFNTWNCLYIDNMCSTSRLGLKPSKPTISL